MSQSAGTLPSASGKQEASHSHVTSVASQFAILQVQRMPSGKGEAQLAKQPSGNSPSHPGASGSVIGSPSGSSSSIGSPGISSGSEPEGPPCFEQPIETSADKIHTRVSFIVRIADLLRFASSI